MKVRREEAKRIILERCTRGSTEVITLEEAYGRVLAQKAVSPVDVPDEDKSAIDGFAFNTASLKELPARLKVIGETPAGARERLKVEVGEAAYVATGGVIPEGADAAVRIEDARVEGDEVVIDFPVERGTLINFRGSEIKRGETLLQEGELLNWQKVALLAHAGIYRIRVFQKVKVGIITTGTEVLEPEEPHRRGTVRNTNFYALKGLLESSGAEVAYLGKVRDDGEELKRTLEEGFNSCQIVVTTGGVSKGKYDLVKEVVKELGVELLFTQTNVRPGRPLTFGIKGNRLFFGLPGYPTATVVNALEFLLPAVRKTTGRRDYENRYLPAVAGERMRSRRGRVDFVRVILQWEGNCLKAFPLKDQQTSNYLSTARAEGFAVIGRERGEVKPGERVEVLPLPDYNCL